MSSRKMSSKSSSSSAAGSRHGVGSPLHLFLGWLSRLLREVLPHFPWTIPPLDLTLPIPTLCLLLWPPHLFPELAAPPGPPESGLQTDGSSSGKQRHRWAHGGRAGSSRHTTAPLGFPGAQPHSTFAPVLS